jgi:FKBP-type peptidyl-prolyl cis-trans isomerase
MYPFKKHKKKPPPPWLKWAIIGFLVLAVLTRSHKDDPNSPNVLSDAYHKSVQILDPNKLFNYEKYKDKLLPHHIAPLRYKDISTGTGTPAMCGQEVSIAYDSFLLEGNAIGDTAGKDKPLTFRIGQHSVMPAFEQGVIGMQKGGKRSLLAPSDMSYGIKEYANKNVPENNDARLEVELLNATPAVIDFAATPFRVIDDGIGPGFPIACGDTVKVNVKLWDMEGKKLYETTEPLSFTIGKSEAFLGLEQGLLGLKKGGTRILIVPPVLQKTMNGNPVITNMHLPPHQTVLVDVQALP